jgi:hypothetical protein
MQVAQRGTSDTGVPSGSRFLVDRWFQNMSATDAQTTLEQSTDAPDGFKNSLKVTTTTVSTATTYGIIEQRIEGQDLQHLNWGSSTGNNLVASFWVKSSKTGTMCFGAYTTDVTQRTFVKTFTYNTANTWQKITINIPNDTSGSIANDSNTGFRVWVFFDGGGAWASGTQQDGWANHTTADILVDVDTNILSTLNATFQMTGFQLEVGEIATPFEHRSFGEELALCQRYYYNTYEYGTTPGTATYDNCFGFRSVASTSSNYLYFENPVTMRATPTVTWYGTTAATNTAGNIRGSSDAAVSASTGTGTGTRFITVNFTANTVHSYISGHYEANSEL